MLNNGPKHFKSSPDQRVAPLLRPVYPKLNKFCQANNASHSNAETGTHVYRYIIHTLSLSLSLISLLTFLGPKSNSTLATHLNSITTKQKLEVTIYKKKEREKKDTRVRLIARKSDLKEIKITDYSFN